MLINGAYLSVPEAFWHHTDAEMYNLAYSNDKENWQRNKEFDVLNG